MYMITKYDYQTGKETVESVHSDKYNALNELQSMVMSYVQKVDGLEKLFTIFTAKSLGNSHRRVRHAIMAQIPGHYVVVDSNDHIHRWVIWQKYEESASENSYFSSWIGTGLVNKARKVFDLDIVEVSTSIFQQMFSHYRNQSIMEHIDKSNLCPDISKSRQEFNRTFLSLPTSIELREKIDMTNISPKISDLRESHPTDFGKWIKPQKTESNQTNTVPPIYLSMWQKYNTEIDFPSIISKYESKDQTETKPILVPKRSRRSGKMSIV